MSGSVLGVELSGSIALESRFFEHIPIDQEQHGDNASIALNMEIWHEWDERRQSLALVPYLRLDQHDTKRTHFDMRELTWIYVGDTLEWRLGIQKVFWGVAESQHLVDIINQSDLVDNIDTEDKLGQPMVNLAWIQDWGTLDLFVLPYFRERTFPGLVGRFRSIPRVDTDQAAVYESTRGKYHIDYAARWSHALGVWDVGLSHFYGTNRDPRFAPGLDSGGNAVLIPHYDLMHQTGLDIQATVDAWLLKLEAIRRIGSDDRYVATTAGIEYSFFGIADTSADLGLVMEHMYDSRGNAATTPFENDVLVGLRLALNDEQSTQALLGIIKDTNSNASSLSLEASRRLGERLTLGVEARKFMRAEPNDPAFFLRSDDYVQVDLAFHF